MGSRGIALLAMALPLLGAAPSSAGSPSPPDPEVSEEAEYPANMGSRTKAWLERQRSGEGQSGNPQGLSPPEEYRVRTRHLESFTHPIPPLFEFEELGSDGS